VTEAKPARWIISPSIDLTCISAGWLLFFLLPALSEGSTEHARVVAFTFFVAHRYFTFPLVYLDRTEFSRRKWTYLITPIVCIGGVWLCYYFRVDEPEMFVFWWFFNYFHFVRQKYGILRIYSGKGKWGIKRLDEIVIYGWGAAGIIYMLAVGAEIEGRLTHYLVGEPVWLYAIVVLVAVVWTIDEWSASESQSKMLIVGLGTTFLLFGLLLSYLVSQPGIEMGLVYAVYALCTLLTIAWLLHEMWSPYDIHWPKILFVLSVVVLYGVGPKISTVAVLIATSFSHAAEYIALVGLSIQNKARTPVEESPFLHKAAEHIVLYTILFIAVVSGGLQLIKVASMFVFLVFTYGTSFMHFVYDGMIWKLRRPRVAQEVGAGAEA
jgi:hypothetical protein